MMKRQWAVGNGEKAKGKGQKAKMVREHVTFLTIYIYHSFSLSPVYQLYQPYLRYQLPTLFFNAPSSLLTCQPVNLSTTPPSSAQ
jgi:hypothetical protein